METYKQCAVHMYIINRGDFKQALWYNLPINTNIFWKA